MTNKTLGFLGLIAKAGALAYGTFATEKTVKSGKAYLVLIANDASENTKKDICNLCDGHEVPYRIWMNKEQLGTYVGKGERTVLAVTNEGFADALVKKIDQGEEN